MKNILKPSLTILLSLFLFNQVTLAGFSVYSGDEKNIQFNYLTTPNKVIKSSINIVNKSDTDDLQISLYSTDGFQNKSGGISFTTLKDVQKTIGLWTKLNNNKLTLMPSQEINVPFTITIPKTALPGDYYGGIAVETKNLIKTESAGPTVESNTRIVKTVRITIPGQINHIFNLNSFTLENVSKEKISFNMDLSNKGNTNLIISGKIDILDKSDTVLKTIDINNIILLQGESTFTKELLKPDLIGFYKAKLYLEVKYENLEKRTLDLITSAEKEINFHFIPIEFIVVPPSILLLVIIIIVFFIIRKKLLIKDSLPYTIVSGDTLESLAQKYQINWKTIASINNINAPYSLEVGKIILIPQKK